MGLSIAGCASGENEYLLAVNGGRQPTEDQKRSLIQWAEDYCENGETVSVSELEWETRMYGTSGGSEAIKARAAAASEHFC